MFTKLQIAISSATYPISKPNWVVNDRIHQLQHVYILYNCSIGGYTHAFHYGKQWICFEKARKVKNIVKFCLKFMIAFAKLSRRDILNVAKLIILCDFHSLKIWIWKNFPENPNKNIIIVKIRSLAPFANAILQHFTVILPVWDIPTA